MNLLVSSNLNSLNEAHANPDDSLYSRPNGYEIMHSQTDSVKQYNYFKISKIADSSLDSIPGGSEVIRVSLK